jgi:hypothetical protein
MTRGEWIKAYKSVSDGWFHMRKGIGPGWHYFRPNYPTIQPGFFYRTNIIDEPL